MATPGRSKLSPDQLVALVELAGRTCETSGNDEAPDAPRPLNETSSEGLLATIQAQIPSALAQRSPERGSDRALFGRAASRLWLAAAAVLAIATALALHRSPSPGPSSMVRASPERLPARPTPYADTAEIAPRPITSHPSRVRTVGPAQADDADHAPAQGKPALPAASLATSSTPSATQERPTAKETATPRSTAGPSPRGDFSADVDRLPRLAHATYFSDPALSSFPLRVTSDSYARTRRALARHALPDPGSVRVEEFLNAFDYGDPAPTRGDFELTAEGAPSPFKHGVHLLRFGIHARAAHPQERAPAQLTLVVETPSTRPGASNLDRMQPALDLLFDRLEPGDLVGLVVYGAVARVLVQPTADLDVVRGKLRQAFALAIPGGNAEVEDGVRVGYQLALDSFAPAKTNRIVLCYDGRSEVSPEVTPPLSRRIAEGRARGIGFAAVGFDVDEALDDVVSIERLAALGGGTSFYVHTPQRASPRLADALLDRHQVVARDAKTRVRFERGVVRRFQLLSSATVRPSMSDAEAELATSVEVEAGGLVTALYELELAHAVSPGATVATVTLDYVDPRSGEPREISHRVLGRDLASSWERAAPSLRLSSVVAELAATLGAEAAGVRAPSARLLESGQQLLVDYPQRGDVRELVDLVGSTRMLQAARPASTP